MGFRARPARRSRCRSWAGGRLNLQGVERDLKWLNACREGIEIALDCLEILGVKWLLQRDMRRRLGRMQTDTVGAIQLDCQLAHEVVGWLIDQQRESNIHKGASGSWCGAHYTRSWLLLYKLILSVHSW